MMDELIKSKCRDLAVRIGLNGGRSLLGSGVILAPRHKEYALVLTAAHIFNELNPDVDLLHLYFVGCMEDPQNTEVAFVPYETFTDLPDKKTAHLYKHSEYKYKEDHYPENDAAILQIPYASWMDSLPVFQLNRQDIDSPVLVGFPSMDNFSQNDESIEMNAEYVTLRGDIYCEDVQLTNQYARNLVVKKVYKDSKPFYTGNSRLNGLSGGGVFSYVNQHIQYNGAFASDKIKGENSFFATDVCVFREMIHSFGFNKGLENEEIINRFEYGINVLAAYLKLNNKVKYTDINILSEGFAEEMLNALYNWRLVAPTDHYTYGYDLVSVRDKIVVQVMTEYTTEKVNESFSKLEKCMNLMCQKRAELERTKEEIRNDLECEEAQRNNEIRKIEQDLNEIIDISGYTVFFLFLKEDTNCIINCEEKSWDEFIAPDGLTFNQSENVLSFESLIAEVEKLTQLGDTEKIETLTELMKKNRIFARIEDNLLPQNKIERIIDDYAAIYQRPLFLHRYENEKVTLENLFVEPRLTRVDYSDYEDVEDRLWDNDSESGIVPILDRFLWGSKKDRLLFIDGDAAIGKSSLVSWLCFHYRKQDEIGKSLFVNIRLICIKLRELSALKSVSSIDSAIKEYLSISELEDVGPLYENALLVLEGADELSLKDSDDSITVEKFILHIRHSFADHKIIITSRSKFIKMDQILKQSKGYTIKHYVINHFSQKERIKWIENYQDKEKCGEIVDDETYRFIVNLTDEESAGIADTPLGLYLIAYHKVNSVYIRNKWNLYHEIFRNHIINTPYNEYLCKTGASHPALEKDDFANKIYELVGIIANQMFINRRDDRNDVSITEVEDIIEKEYPDNLDKNTRDLIKSSCLLCSYWKNDKNTDALEFYHNNIRDFFMAEYIYNRFFSKSFSSNPQDNIDYLIGVASDVFQYGLIPKPTWTQTFLFLYERLRDEKDKISNIINRFNGIESLFSKTIYQTVNNRKMWAYGYKKDYYDSIKYTFLNFVLFLRVWIFAINQDNLNTFKNEEFYDFFHRQRDGIFYDWISMFANSIELQENKYISFGSHMNYSKMKLSDLNFDSACFQSSSFENCVFNSSNLRNSIFINAKLYHSSFKGANLIGAKFDGSEIIDTDFENAQLSGARFSGATLKSVDFNNIAAVRDKIKFDKAVFESSEFKKVDTDSLDFDDAEFNDCKLIGLQFNNNANNCKFNNCTIENVRANNISHISFTGYENKEVITQVSFSGHLECIEFNKAYVDRCELKSASVGEISFMHCKVVYLSLHDVNIKKLKMNKCTIKENVVIDGGAITRSALSALEECNAKVDIQGHVRIIEDYS